MTIESNTTFYFGNLYVQMDEEQQPSPSPSGNIQTLKEIEITTNTETRVTPDEGYDAMAEVSVTTLVTTPTTIPKATNLILYDYINNNYTNIETISLSQLTKHTNPNNAVTIPAKTVYIIPQKPNYNYVPENFIMAAESNTNQLTTSISINTDYYTYTYTDPNNTGRIPYALLTNASSITDYINNTSQYMGLLLPLQSTFYNELDMINSNLIDTTLLPTQ